jgi:6-phosphogluconolactonase (cycloisomerase 2 family)
MDISPDGNWLVVLDGTASFSGEVTIDVFQINLTTGVLTQQFPNTYYSFGSNQIVPRAIKFSPNEASIGVAVGTSGDLVYTFTASSSSGLLSAALSSPQLISAPATPMSDNGLAWGPNNATLYITRSNSTSNGVVAQYTAYTTYPTGVQPTSVAVNTAGTNEYVYVANQSVQGSISGYSVASDGVLTALAALPYTAGSYVAALAVDSTGDYLLAAALGGSPDLELFSFASGQLAPSATASTGGGTEPAGAVAVATTH